MSTSVADQLSGAVQTVHDFLNTMNLQTFPNYEGLAKSLNEFCHLAPLSSDAACYIIDNYWNTGDKESLKADLLMFIQNSNERALPQPKNIKKEYYEAPIHALSVDYDKEAQEKLAKELDAALKKFDAKYAMSKAGKMQAPHDSDTTTIKELQELREEMLAEHRLGFFV
uniref:ATP synthase subunit d, mitochondrial n=1 Tax=Panagrellus redivivus TaxID=6233 RepID=A0A7E4V9Y8_PANRE